MNRKNALDGMKNALWALGFAVGIWYLADQNITQEAPWRVRLTVRQPEGLTVTYLDHDGHPTDEPVAMITVKAPRNVLTKMAEWPAEAVYQLKPGFGQLDTAIPLEVSKFQFRGIPREVEIRETVPESISIMLAQERSAKLGIDLIYDEKSIPEGWEIDKENTAVIPPAIWSKGPAAKMLGEPRFKTEPIDIRKELEFKGWTPSDRRAPPEIVLPSVILTPPDPSIKSSASVTARVKLRAKPDRWQTELRPELVMPLPGVPYRLVGRLEKVKFTLEGPQSELAELKPPGEAEKKIRLLAVVPPDIKVGPLAKLNVEVKLPEGSHLHPVEKELTYDVEVSEWEPATTPASGENR